MTTRKTAFLDCPEEIDLTTRCEMILAAGFIGANSATLDLPAQVLFRSKLLEAFETPGDDLPAATKFMIGVALESSADPSYAARLIDYLVSREES